MAEFTIQYANHMKKSFQLKKPPTTQDIVLNIMHAIHSKLYKEEIIANLFIIFGRHWMKCGAFKDLDWLNSQQTF